jgi:CTP synthase (UTP-ammonia lyase)
MAEPVRIGIIGDFNPDYRSHLATNAALSHAAGALGLEVEVNWLPTPTLAGAGLDRQLAGYHGFWAASGSPYGSMAGALAGIQFARVRNWPFVGT